MKTVLDARVSERTQKGIGESVDRSDASAKVSGSFEYGSDLWADGMLYGHTVRSPLPHAEILGVDILEAVGAAGVHAVLLASDVPGRKTYGAEFADQPVLAWDKVRYVGEPVAIIAAEHPELARRAAARVQVDYKPLPALTDMQEALLADAPRLREFGNVLRHVRIVHGDPNAKAEIWVEGYYETGMQDQAPLGPEAGMAVPAADGGVDLHVATQWLHIDRQQIAPCLSLPEDRVRLYLSGIGGAFGAREDVSMQIHACLLALRTGRPVRMSYGRSESFVGHVHRHPSRIWMRTGATPDGRLVNVRARILLDGGAYASTSASVIANATSFAAGPYEVPNALLDGTVVFTNNPPCGAMRGFGAVQACFGYEGLMDKLSAKLGIDPVEIRLLNALHPGSTLPTGQTIRGSAPGREVIKRCAAFPLPNEPGEVRDPIDVPGGVGNVGHGNKLRRGVGFAFGYKNIAYSEGFDDAHEARVRLVRSLNGPKVEVHSAAAEVGQGIHTVLAQIARTNLGVDDVVIGSQDTSIGSAGSSSASRQTMMAGGAVHLASLDVRDELLARARTSSRLRAHAGVLSVEGGEVLADGHPVVRIEDLLDEPIEATHVYHHPPTTKFDERGQGDIYAVFTFAAARAVVDVDEDLGLVRVVDITASQDVGRAINPRAVEGQIEGGVAQGLGLALTEELHVERGVIQNASFTDYLIPTILDMPPVATAIIEDPEPGVPLGMKGAGEQSIVVVPAAIAAALRDATRRDVNRIPVTPDDLIGLAPPAERGSAPPIPNVPGPNPLPHTFGLGLPTELDAS